MTGTEWEDNQAREGRRRLSRNGPTAGLVRRHGALALAGPALIAGLAVEAHRAGLLDPAAAVVAATVLTFALLGALLAVVALRLERTEAERREHEARARISESQFRSLVESSPDAMVIVDAEGAIVMTNAQTEVLLGYKRSQLLGRPVELLIPERFRHGHVRQRAVFARAPATRPMGDELELLARRVDGREIPVEIGLTEVQSDAGTHIAATIRDVSERRAADEIRRRLAAIVEHTDDAVFSTTAAGAITSWNGGADLLYGYSPGEAIGMAMTTLVPADRELDEAQILERVIAGGEVERYETVHVRKDGSRLDVSLTMSPIRDSGGAVVGASTIARDITERKRFVGQLQYLADHDALTGLFNRRRFEEDIERELARARRNRAGGALLAIDLDNFKSVNDSLGHSAGDELIKRASELFRSRLRTTDLIARLGGDEFAVMLPGVDTEGARLVATGLLQAIRGEGRFPGTAGRPITASIGIVSFAPGEELTPAELLAEADIAMYDAKAAGRNRAASYDDRGDGSERLRIHTTWQQRIRNAIDEDRLVLMAQPIVRLAGRSEPRRELLVRMLSEDGELIPPGVFLHAAERYDLIQEIDRWVLRQAVRRLAREQRAGRTVNLGINLAPKTVADPDFPAELAQELKSAGASGRGLWLEVTETSAILNVDRARMLAGHLRELGCEFAVDDFGAGFASFYYLKHLTFDYVKIDSEFIAQLRESTTNQLVVKSIVDITHGLGKQTIAECVSDRATVELLRSFGVDYAQGFYFGVPERLDEVDLVGPLGPPAADPWHAGAPRSAARGATPDGI
jgi:diguanylate cyclase (GGDEF)-like protein/PAS domain S-box-containing protein